MNSQLTSNAEALRLFFTDDVYLVNDKIQSTPAEVVIVAEIKDVEFKTTTSVPAQVANRLTIVEEPVSAIKREWRFEFLGKNEKKILILVNDHVNKVSSEQGTALLRKLVKAIELTNNDFALVNYANYANANLEDLKSFFECELVLSFGVEMQTLGLTAQPLHQLIVLDDIKFVFAKNLHDLDSDQLSKKVLWSSLQQLK